MSVNERAEKQASVGQRKTDEHDLVILDSGTGTRLAAWTLAAQGQRVAVIERQYISGGRPNIACMSKARMRFTALKSPPPCDTAMSSVSSAKPSEPTWPAYASASAGWSPARLIFIVTNTKVQSRTHSRLSAIRRTEDRRGTVARWIDSPITRKECNHRDRHPRTPRTDFRPRQCAAAHPCGGSGARSSAQTPDHPGRR